MCLGPHGALLAELAGRLAEASGAPWLPYTPALGPLQPHPSHLTPLGYGEDE